MIFYFSATGNSKYAAEYIAKEIGVDVVDIVKCIENHDYSFDADGETVGIVCPIYFQGLPKIVKKFLRKVQVENYGHFFFAVTYGFFSGSLKAMIDEVKWPWLDIDAYYTIRMPDTWTPVFNLSNPKKVARKNRHAQIELEDVAQSIYEREHGDFTERKVPQSFAKLFLRMYPIAAKTSHLSVDEGQCIGCGLCEKRCPAHAIKMEDGHPVWVKDQCIMCLGCLHRCPKFAIQYGKSTKRHGQYRNPNTTI